MTKRRSNATGDATIRFLAGLFRVKPEAIWHPQEPHEPPKPVARMSGALTPQNQPEFWADAPWRLEPDVDELPVTFTVRDGDLRLPGKGPWRLDLLKLEQRLPDGSWHKLTTVSPADVCHVDEQGNSACSFWTHSLVIPLSSLKGAQHGEAVHLRATFAGSFAPHARLETTIIHLETVLAEHGLPAGRAASTGQARRWFYGDTHYHSAYSNDVKEFGGAVADARAAGLAIGLN